jgi:hypothetical protein
MAIHEQQTRIATIAAIILGVGEDWVVPISIEMEPPEKFCSSYTETISLRLGKRNPCEGGSNTSTFTRVI